MNWIFNFVWPALPKRQPATMAYSARRGCRLSRHHAVRSTPCSHAQNGTRKSPAAYTVRGEDTHCEAILTHSHSSASPAFAPLHAYEFFG